MNEKITELEEKIKRTANPSELVYLLNELSGVVRSGDASRALEFAEEAKKLAGKHKDKKGLAVSLRNMGVANRLLSEYKKAVVDLEESLQIFKELGEVKEQGKVLNSTANVYANTGEYSNSLKILNESLELSKSVNDLENTASVLSNMGVIFQETGDYPSSLEKYLESIQVYNDLGQEVPEILYNNVGVVYHQLGDYPEALGYYLRSLGSSKEIGNKLDEGFALLNIAVIYGEMKEHDKALEYLASSLEILKGLGNKLGESDVLRNIGIAYQSMEDYDKALEFQFKVLKVREEISDMAGKADTFNHIGSIYYQTGKLGNAEKYYKDAFMLAKQIDNKMIETMSLLHLGRVSLKEERYTRGFEYLFAALGLAQKRNAVKEMFEIHSALYDGFKMTGEAAKALFHLEKAYELEKDISNLAADKKLKSLTIQHQIETANREKKIALQDKEIFRLKNVELAEINDRLNFINEEKNMFLGIAAHDLKNPLSGIMSFAKKIQKSSDSKQENIEFAKEIEKAAEKMFRLVIEVLDITAIESGKRNLNFEVFNPSLVAQRAVFDYRERSEAKQIQIIYFAEENLTVESDKTALRQILDNLVSNAVKFTPPGRNVYVSVKKIDNKIVFEVKDEGPGLTEKDKPKLFGKFTRLSAQPTAGEDSTGLGLSIVKNLTEVLGGNISYNSILGDGCTFILRLPLVSNRTFEKEVAAKI